MRLNSGLVLIFFPFLVAWGPSVASAEEVMSAECIAFRADVDANIGEIMSLTLSRSVSPEWLK